MIAALKQLLPQIESWPAEDQEALAFVALEIESARHGVIIGDDEELEAIDLGLADADAGRFASPEAVEAVRAKFRAA